MCVVVQHLTHDFNRLINLLKGCNGMSESIMPYRGSHRIAARLLGFVRQPSRELDKKDTSPMLILIFIVALLGEHCNFDRLRVEHPSKPFRACTSYTTT
jgi:cohesin loading factor subunit SCC2